MFEQALIGKLIFWVVGVCQYRGWRGIGWEIQKCNWYNPLNINPLSSILSEENQQTWAANSIGRIL